MSTLPITPFRWDIRKRETLGRLLDGEPASAYPGFFDDLRMCVARILAFAGDSDLVFVGRSPESLFDYLSGVFFDTDRSDRLNLLHVSVRYDNPGKLTAEEPEAVAHLRDHLTELGLDPRGLIARARPAALVDIVDTGATFGNLTRLLEIWCNELGLEWRAMHRKIRYVGVTVRTKTSPKTWRWQQHCDWVSSVPESVIKNVSAPHQFFHYLGAGQAKTTISYSWRQWGKSEAARPRHDESNLAALRLAHQLFEHGQTNDERLALATELSKQLEMRDSWFRNLVADIKTTPK